jgi:lysophospholipase L1-like esterase
MLHRMIRVASRLPGRALALAAGLLLLLSGVAGRSEAQAPDALGTTDRFAIPATDDGLPGVGPIRRYDWFQKLWRSRRATWAAERDRDQGAVVFLGDSITQQWERGMPAAFPGMKIANRGISGDTTRGLLVRLDEDVFALNPSAVVLLIGTNDLEEGATPEMVEQNMRILLSRLGQHNRRMPIILSLVFPSAASMKRPSALIRDINARYLSIIKNDPQVIPLETFRLFADANGDAPKTEFPDLLHPNDAGYAKWASALRPVLEAHGLLPVAPDTFTPEPGFELLFNGRDLTGWGYRPTTDADKESARRWQASDPNAAEWPFLTETTSFNGRDASTDGRFRVVGGRIVVTTPPGYRVIQQLWTEREFAEDFVLKLEFRATPFADSGLYLRRTQQQIRDYGLAGPYTTLKNYRPQDWNEIVVTVRGGVAEVTCNGEVLEKALKIPASGPLGLEGDRGQTEYRRIRIQRLPS